MERSIAEGQFSNRRPVWLTAAAGRSRAGDRRWVAAIGLAIAGLILLIYLACNPNRHNFYEHFTWQAAAWLEGQAGIRYPVCSSEGTPTFPGDTCLWVADKDAPYNDFFLDVLPVNGTLHDGDVVSIEARDREVFYTAGLIGSLVVPLPRDIDLNVLQAIATE